MDDLQNNNETYKQRRERNNEAVKKSRAKSRNQTQETVQKVKRLKNENSNLHQKIKLISKEIELIKNLFMKQAGVSHFQLSEAQIEFLKNDENVGRVADVFPDLLLDK